MFEVALGGLLPLDVLLAGLEGQTEGILAETVNGDSDDTAGNISLVLVAGGHPACRRATVTHAESESLGSSDSYVGSPCGGLLHDCQCEDVAVGGHEHAGLVGCVAEHSGSKPAARTSFQSPTVTFIPRPLALVSMTEST